MSDRMQSCAYVLVALCLICMGVVAHFVAAYALTWWGTLLTWGLGVMLLILGGTMLAVID